MFTLHRGDFRAGPSSLRFPLMALHSVTWYHHKTSCRRESPQRDFTSVVVPGRESLSGTKSRNCIMYTRNDHTFRCADRLELKAHAKCLRFWITWSTWSVPSNSEIRKWRSHHVNAIRNLKFIPVWNSRWCEFSRVNTRLFNPRLGLAAAYPGRGVLGWASES